MINDILKGHGGKYACAYCIGPATFESGELRTFGSMAMCYDRFIAAGGKLKEANKFSNVIHPSLIKVDAEKLVLDQFPPLNFIY
jgi:hypothetical protein